MNCNPMLAKATLLYRILVVSLISSSLNIAIVSFSKYSRTTAVDQRLSSRIVFKRNKLADSVKPASSLALRLMQDYGAYLQNKNWPLKHRGSDLSYYSRFLLANLVLLSILILKREFFRQQLAIIIDKTLQGQALTRRIRITALFIIIFSIITWIARLHWGFWMMGIWGWNYQERNLLRNRSTGKQSTEYSSNPSGKRSAYEVPVVNCERFLNYSLMISAVNKSKIPFNFNRPKDIKNIFYITTKVKIIGSSSDHNQMNLISDGAYGFVFPELVFSNANVDQSELDKATFNALVRRIENYKKYGGPFLLPTHIAYPPHTPYNYEHLPELLAAKYDMLTSASIEYRVQRGLSQKPRVSVASLHITSCKKFHDSDS
jgi:hypothetical protein